MGTGFGRSRPSLSSAIDMSLSVRLRDVAEADLPVFFAHHRDPQAVRMADFPPRDEAAFMAHWRRLLRDGSILKQTILVNGETAGHVVCFGPAEERLVGYWIGREHWGRGVATQALTLFLERIPQRPLYAHAAPGNKASIRVLEKCGFQPAASADSDEVTMKLA